MKPELKMTEGLHISLAPFICLFCGWQGLDLDISCGWLW
jgi:hypothetical protein